MNFYATIARYYDSEHYDKDEDIPLYQELAEETSGAILVVGSGTGRLMIALADMGYTVHGIEIEPAMMARAEQKRAAKPHLQDKLFFHLGDALDYTLDERFGLIIIPYNTFMHFLNQDEQIGLLERCADWLTDDGLLVLDLPNAGETFGSLDTEAVTLERTFPEQETGRLVMQQSSSRLDRTEQTMYVTWMYDEIGEDGTVKRTVVPTTLHYYFLSELSLLLQVAGLSVDVAFGDFDHSPFEEGAPRMIVVAAKAGI